MWHPPTRVRGYYLMHHKISELRDQIRPLQSSLNHHFTTANILNNIKIFLKHALKVTALLNLTCLLLGNINILADRLACSHIYFRRIWEISPWFPPIHSIFRFYPLKMPLSLYSCQIKETGTTFLKDFEISAYFLRVTTCYASIYKTAGSPNSHNHCFPLLCGIIAFHGLLWE